METEQKPKFKAYFLKIKFVHLVHLLVDPIPPTLATFVCYSVIKPKNMFR